MNITDVALFRKMFGGNGGGGGGASSWNDLTDKPFGDNVAPPPITFNPDTDITDDSVWFAERYIKVSDNTFAVEDLIGGTLETDFGVISLHAGNTFIYDGLTAVVVNDMPLIAVITAEMADLVGAETGTYFIYADGVVVTSLAFPEQVTKIDPKYLPDTEWDNIVNNPFGRVSGIAHDPITDANITDESPSFNIYYDLYKASDDVFEKSHLIGAKFYGTGQYMPDPRPLVEDDIEVGSNGELLVRLNNVGAYFAVVNEDAAAIMGVEAGTYFSRDRQCLVTRLEFNEVVKKIDQKYMPNQLYLAGEDGKTYRLSVDASGQVIATAE